jgi:hypothetical protein
MGIRGRSTLIRCSVDTYPTRLEPLMPEAVELNTRSGSLVRSILAILAGAILWMIGFLILARILVLLWPAYALAAQIWTRTRVYTFTSPMSVFNASFWILAEIAAGWLAAVIARRPQAVWSLAVLVMGYLCFMHLYYVWDQLPWWYNLVVALASGPAVLLGGRFGRTTQQVELRTQQDLGSAS